MTSEKLIDADDFIEKTKQKPYLQIIDPSPQPLRPSHQDRRHTAIDTIKPVSNPQPRHRSPTPATSAPRRSNAAGHETLGLEISFPPPVGYLPPCPLARTDRTPDPSPLWGKQSGAIAGLTPSNVFTEAYLRRHTHIHTPCCLFRGFPWMDARIDRKQNDVSPSLPRYNGALPRSARWFSLTFPRISSSNNPQPKPRRP